MNGNNSPQKAKLSVWHLVIDFIAVGISVAALVISFGNLSAARQSARAAQEANRLAIAQQTRAQASEVSSFANSNNPGLTLVVENRSQAAIRDAFVTFGRPGGLFKTPCEREEEQSACGIICVPVGGVGATVVCVEDPP
jgi:hypothetical protein